MRTLTAASLIAGAAVLTLGAVAIPVIAHSAPRAVPHHAVPAATGESPPPLGQGGGWTLAFRDEFDGTSLDPARWADESSAEADAGHGNKDNDQLEWNRADNCVVSGGELQMTARRESMTSPSGVRYDWTSCLLSSTPSFEFRYGYIEERAVLPAPAGFWPAFWTWQVPGLDAHIETDVYEYHSADHERLDLTQHSGQEGSCHVRPWFDPSEGWHTYGASIEPSGTTWYVDGNEVCHADATSDGMTNIISNLAVHASDPPGDGTDEAVKRVDYIRAWRR